jgi:hypothetical protein
VLRCLSAMRSWAITISITLALYVYSPLLSRKSTVKAR